MLTALDRLRRRLNRNYQFLEDCIRYDFKGYANKFKIYKNFWVKNAQGFYKPVITFVAIVKGWGKIKWGTDKWGA